MKTAGVSMMILMTSRMISGGNFHIMLSSLFVLVVVDISVLGKTYWAT